MKRFKHILAPTDLSPSSLSTVSFAAHLAKAQGARLTVLHVPHSLPVSYTDLAPPITMDEIERAIEKSATTQLERWAARHLRKLPRSTTLVRRGDTSAVICQAAEQLGASVIVMATHGRKGLSHVVLGSVTERVLRDAPCPVLVVRPPKGTVVIPR
jgi:nucleotide-binding universal stress UspA family protein